MPEIMQGDSIHCEDVDSLTFLAQSVFSTFPCTFNIVYVVCLMRQCLRLYERFVYRYVDHEGQTRAQQLLRWATVWPQ